MAFAGWFPRFSPEGHYLAAGDLTITVATVAGVTGTTVQLTNEIGVGEGIAPAWITNTPRTLLWWNRHDALLHAQEAVFAPLVLQPGVLTQGHLGASGYGYDAGGGKWITYLAGPDQLRVSDGTIIAGGAAPAMDQNGRYVYRVGDHQLIVSGVGVIRTAPIGVINPHIATQGVVWGEFVSPTRRETYGWRGGGVEVVHASAGTEFWSIPIDTPEGPWILSDDSVNLYLRPWGASQLQIVGPGDTFFPHAVYSTALGGFLIAWSDSAGNLATAFIESDATGVVPGVPGGGGPGSPPPLSGAPTPGQIAPRRPAHFAPVPKAIYPHVQRIQDLEAQQSVRLLWDKIHQLGDRLDRGDIRQALDGQTSQIGALTTRLDTQQTELEGDPSEGLATSLPGGTPGAPPPPGGGDPPPPPPGGGGCADSPGNGHYQPGGALTEERARKIVCGTGDEWAGLRVPTPTLADRETNAETLLRRCIWHLDQGGYDAGRQRNPSLAISKDKLTIIFPGAETRAFDIFSSFDDHTITMAMAWTEVFPADYVADAGIAD